MQQSFPIEIFFHGSLNDFLPLKKQSQWITHSCTPTSSAKDTIEAIGVPHVEVHKILVNEQEQPFAHQLHLADKIEVFPFENSFPPAAPKAFVLDVHLGALARLLRMLGVDASYQNNWHDNEIVTLATNENRALLTRDIGLLKHKVLQWGYWLRSQQPEEQAAEIIRMFSLCEAFRPFSRCIACNGNLLPVEKSRVLHSLQPQTAACFDDFYQCKVCRKAYWKGLHYEHMLQTVERITSLACQ